MRTQIAIVTIVAAGSLAAGCAHPKASEPKALQPVKTQTVAKAAPAAGVRYSASIEPFEQVPLAFKATGYVLDLMRQRDADGQMRVLQAGDRVTRNAVLAQLRDTDYRERLMQSRAKLAEAEASLTKSRLDLERARSLFGADSLTKPDLDAAQAAFDGAEARIAAARAEIELALSALGDCTLIAPATGVVLERRIEVGTLASAGTVGFVIGDVSSVKARFGIPDAMVQSVRLGDAIEVTVDAAAPTAFSGRITAIAPAADSQSRVFDIEVTVPNREGLLRPGMIGTVALTAGRGSVAATGPSPLVVPLSAVVRSDAGAGPYAVLVVERHADGDVARMRRVELGDVLGHSIAVRQGLQEGEQVVVNGATLLADGTPVRVLP